MAHASVPEPVTAAECLLRAPLAESRAARCTQARGGLCCAGGTKATAARRARPCAVTARSGARAWSPGQLVCVGSAGRLIFLVPVSCFFTAAPCVCRGVSSALRKTEAEKGDGHSGPGPAEGAGETQTKLCSGSAGVLAGRVQSDARQKGDTVFCPVTLPKSAQHFLSAQAVPADARWFGQS